MSKQTSIQRDIAKNIKWILTKAREQGFSAIVAGGAVRDYYYDIVPSDYDVYLQAPPNTKANVSASHWRRILNAQSSVVVSNTNYGTTQPSDQHDSADDFWFDDLTAVKSDTYRGSNISCIIDVEKNGITYQLIFITEDPIQYVENNFDLGICKCYCSLKGITYSGEFNLDVHQSTITILPTTIFSVFCRTLHYHIPKLKKKFPQHTVILDENWVVPPSFLAEFTKPSI